MFLTRRFYLLFAAVILMVGSGYMWLPLFGVGRALLAVLAFAVAVDVFRLYRHAGIRAMRYCPPRFSNGDDNKVGIRIENSYPHTVALQVVDELPFVFQRRDVCFALSLGGGTEQTISYQLRPVRRGVYEFGRIRLFASTRLGLVQRRYTCGEPQQAAVYPAFLMLRQYELMAISNHLTEAGIKRIRRVGNHTEFEQIKDYVAGDDFRTINWNATARRARLMVNIYEDERSQQLINVIDKGRVMQQAFRGMTLLDYAINASLALSYVAMRKEDRAGLVTFSDSFDTFVPPSRRAGHAQALLDALYSEQTGFGETDYSALVAHLHKHVTKRSLLVLYTNFSGVQSMRRQLEYLRQLNQHHRLLVVFFEDAELKQYIQSPMHDTEEYYQHVIAEKFAYEQQLIVQTLRQHGILSLLTMPEDLSVNVINRYLEIKSSR
jgi:uncharacterized protein (DUF58 family)